MGSRLRPLLLTQSLRKLPSPSSQNIDTRLSSIEIDAAQQEFLSLPSPYHDNFSIPDAPPLPRSSEPASPFTSLFKRFRYSSIASDAENIRSKDSNRLVEEDDDDVESSDVESAIKKRRRSKHRHQSEYKETLADRWLAVLFLLLLLSGLFNVFLVFNGSPNNIPRSHKERGNPLPHKGFQFTEHGRNYTCFEMRNTVLKEDKVYQNTFAVYDQLWDDLGGGSNGVVYTRIGRDDGRVRIARMGMFHQLSCLAALRSVVQALEKGEEFPNVSGKVHQGDWLHCLDYLRQVIQCNADDTIEISKLVNGKWVNDGFGGQRQCRDSTWLYDITKCGEGGCEGRPFYWEEQIMESIHQEEKQAIEKWWKAHNS